MISPASFCFSWEAIQEVPLLRIKITGQGDEEHIKYQFEWYWYPIELEIKDTTETDSCTSYLDLHIDIDSVGRLRTKLYDKRNEFNFPIVNFPFICSKIPAAPAYGVYSSQMIRHSRACGSYQDFLDRGLMLSRKLLNQMFLLVKLKSLLWKFSGRHHDLVDHYGISVI
jgi:hypothetical protein